MAKETNPEMWERLKRESEADGSDPYEKLKGHLNDSQRAHPGKPGWKTRHGQDAIGKVK